MKRFATLAFVLVAAGMAATCVSARAGEYFWVQTDKGVLQKIAGNPANYKASLWVVKLYEAGAQATGGGYWGLIVSPDFEGAKKQLASNQELEKSLSGWCECWPKQTFANAIGPIAIIGKNKDGKAADRSEGFRKTQSVLEDARVALQGMTKVPARVYGASLNGFIEGYLAPFVKISHVSSLLESGADPSSQEVAAALKSAQNSVARVSDALRNRTGDLTMFVQIPEEGWSAYKELQGGVAIRFRRSSSMAETLRFQFRNTSDDTLRARFSIQSYGSGGKLESGESSIDLKPGADGVPDMSVGIPGMAVKDVRIMELNKTGGGKVAAATPGVWNDSTTGLLWQNPATPATYSVEQAVEYCAGLGGDWHLPSIDELKTMLRGCNVMCAVTNSCPDSDMCWSEACRGCDQMRGPKGGCYWDVAVNGNCSYTEYWTSTGEKNRPYYYWYMDFDSGRINSDYHTSPKYARCVQGQGSSWMAPWIKALYP